jgi:hypothetical protein
MGDNLENERLRVLLGAKRRRAHPSSSMAIGVRFRPDALNFLGTGMSCRQSKIGMAKDVWSSIWRRNRSDGFSTLREKRSTASELR